MQDNYGRSALMLASFYGHIEVAAQLLENGANIDMQDFDGYSALMFASSNGHIKFVQLLQCSNRFFLFTLINNEGSR